MTTNITALARRVEHIISDMKLKHGGNDTYAPIMKWDEFLALVEALEKAQQRIEELREWNAGLAQESFERQQRISELLEGKVGSDLLERENHHVEVVGKLTERIAELESRTVKLPQRLQPGADGYDDWYVHSDDDGEYLKVDDVLAMLTAAGIKVETE
ncbi:TPA: ead/Ea22-like family protein [Klebsiella pneumoniae]